MLRRIGFVVFALAIMAQALSAQWLNYPTPGLPRLPNGKPDLAAKPPRARTESPISPASGTSYSEPLEEKKRLFGPGIAAISVPGSGPETVSNYAWDIMLDYKPGQIVMTPEGAGDLRSTTKGR